MKFLQTLRILDSNKQVSLTNITMMIIMSKLATAPHLDWNTITTFFLALAAYQTKTIISNKKKNNNEQ